VWVSGSKGGSYSYVPSAEELHRRALAEARSRVGDALRTFDVAAAGVAAAAAGHLGMDADLALPPAPAADDLDGLRRYARHVQELTGRARQLAGQAAARRTEALLARAGENFEVASPPSDERYRPEDAGPRADERTNDLAGSVERSLARIPVEADEEDRRACEELAEAALDGVSPTAVHELRRRVQELVVAADRRAHDRRTAADLAALLAPYVTDAEVVPILGRLRAAAAGDAPLHRGADAEVAEVEAAARARRDRHRAAEALGEALDELGYDIEDGFSTLAVDRGVAHARIPTADGYGVRWRVADDRMVFHVVREAAVGGAGEAQRRRDLEVEEAWCQQVDRLLARLADRGVALSLDRLTPPGTHPVHEVDHLPGRAAEAGERRRRRARELDDPR
jgi:hypothetical protein